jgi:hypothetical protein
MHLFSTAVVIASLAIAAHAVTGDLNLDGAVDFDDFFILADNFGKSGPPEEGCGAAEEGTEEPVGTIDDYYPLQVGSEWEYVNPNLATDAYTRKITWSYKVDGIKYFEVNNGTKVYSSAGEFRVVYEAGPESALIKEPLVVGARWQDDYDLEECPRSGSTCGSEIRAVLSQLTVPAGEFEQVLVVAWQAVAGDGRVTSEFIYYIAPGAGVVRRQIRNLQADGTFSEKHYELTGYSIPE